MSKAITPQLKTPLARIPVAEVPNGGAMALDVGFRSGRRSVIVLRRGPDLRAFLNQCPHARWPLDRFDGQFLTTADGALICAAHGAVFDPVSGACLGGPGQGQGLTPVPLRVDGDFVLLEDLP